jgi:hypothetical protein
VGDLIERDEQKGVLLPHFFFPIMAKSLDLRVPYGSSFAYGLVALANGVRRRRMPDS